MTLALEQSSIPPVSLFTNSANSTPSIRNVPPVPETDLDRYHENLKQFRAVERELSDCIFSLRRWYQAHGGVDGRVLISDGELFCKLGALNGEPTLRALESQYNAILRKRSQLLARHAELKTAAGIK